MSKLLHTLSLFLLSLLLTLTGCGDPVVDPDYRGEPLLTITGQLNALPDYQSRGPVHLALVWLPKAFIEGEEGADSGSAFAMVTEDVVFQGSFPAQYRFDIFQPPPEAALGTLEQGLKGRGAFGLLVAYEDLNGNGKLDRIAPDGVPLDRVIGSSLYETGGAYMLAYLDSAQAEGSGAKAGFNLARANAQGELTEVASLSTPLPLTLTPGGDLYDALVCDAGPLTFLLYPVCGLGEGEQPPPPSNLGVTGEVRLKNGRLEVSLQAFYENAALQDAQLTLAGRALPYDAQRERYVLEEDASTLLTPGAEVSLAVSARGESTARKLKVPGAFAISAPGAGEQVSNAGPITAQWTAAEHATAYRVELDSSSFIFSHPADEGALSYTFEAPYSEGPATLRVEASTGGTELFGNFWVTVTLTQEQHFTFTP